MQYVGYWIKSTGPENGAAISAKTHTVSVCAWHCDTAEEMQQACFRRRTDGDELLDTSDDAVAFLVPAPLAPLARQRLVHQLAHLLGRDGDPAAFRVRLRVCTTAQTHLL